MPIRTTYLNKKHQAYIVEDNEKKSAKHKSSGKLSAGMLFQPLRFQVLKTIGVPRKPFDVYTLEVFGTGNRVADVFVKDLIRGGDFISDPVELLKHNLTWDEDKQEARADYRGAVGYVDAVINTKNFERDWGVVPFETKSVVSYKLKRIKKNGDNDWHQKLQACFYALAMGKKYFAMNIISKEHSRGHQITDIYETVELKSDVDQAISAYMVAMENWKKDRTLPPLEKGKVTWAVNPKYAMFTEEWFENDSQCIKKMEELKLI